jgi:hypothetical protein
MEMKIQTQAAAAWRCSRRSAAPHRAPKAPWLREGVSCVPQRLAFVCQLFEPGQCFSVFCAAD